jgi:hypothetical protein
MESSGSMLAQTQALKKPVQISTIFKMFDDTVYAYEFALAQMELAGLSGAKVPFGLPEGIVEANVNVEVLPTLIERLAYFEQVGHEATHQKFLTEVQGAVAGNHAKAYMTHWIYPYKAKFHPQMVRALLNIIGAKKGETILDPMTGSGTLNVEARLMGINSIGVDCLPIGVLASKVKSHALDPIIGRTILEADIPKFRTDLAQHVSESPFLDEIENPEVKDFFQLLYFETLSISRLPKRTFGGVWEKMLRFYLQTVSQSLSTIEKLNIKLGSVDIRLGDARKLDLADESVNHIVNSPPYAIAIDYVYRNTEQLRLMGYSTKEIYENTMGLRGRGDARITNYYADLEQSIREMHRVLKKKGYCVILIGDTQYEKKTLPTIAKAVDFAMNAGLRLVHNIPKVSAGRFGLFRTERILIFQKSA